MRIRPLPSLVLWLLSLTSTELAAQGSWEPRTAMPPGSGRWGSATFVIDGIGYTVGGYDGSTEINDVKAYDPTTDSWQTRSPLPVALRNASGFALNGKGYVACGYSAASGHFNSLYVYDPATNSWSTRASFPGNARYGMASFVVDGIAYVACGPRAARPDAGHLHRPVAGRWPPGGAERAGGGRALRGAPSSQLPSCATPTAPPCARSSAGGHRTAAAGRPRQAVPG